MADIFYRPATIDDADAIAALLNSRDEEFGIVSTWTGASIRSDLSGPSFDLADSSMVAVRPDGTVIGAEIVFDDVNALRASLFGHVDKSWRGHGVGTSLLEWAVARTARNIAKAPAHAQVSVAASLFQQDEPGKRLLADFGFTYLRSNYTMRLDFSGHYEKAPLPDGIRLVTFAELGDLRPFVETLHDAFRDHFGFIESPIEDDLERCQVYIASEPAFDANFWWLAYAGDEPAGVVTVERSCHLGEGYAWVDDLGVLRKFRKRGLGSALLRHAISVCQQHGHTGVGLGVDASSMTNAGALYERAGMYVYLRHERHEKILREGEDLSRH